MTEHIVAVFDTAAAAEAATRDLQAAGFNASAIRRYRQEGSERPAARSRDNSTESTSSSGGFWEWLLGEEATQTTRSAYPPDEEWFDRRANSGNTVLSVRVEEDSRIHLATEILERHHPFEMKETSEETGTGFRATSGGPVSSPQGNESVRSEAHDITGAEEVIPLAEENLEIGKRVVDRGTTRIRRYVVETPVERDVTLRGERVTIERRRPVDTSAPGHAFEERTVEVHETEEVPVVEKSARVVEEVAVRREATERTETVRDTVRREEIEVTDNDKRPASRP